jgi:capsular exopolysaccharide synthesis family protein
MSDSQIIKMQEENDLNKIYLLFLRNYKLFILSVILAGGFAFLINRYSIPVYNISSSILIKENKTQQGGGSVNDFLNSSLLGKNQNFQNELWVMKSSPVLEQTIRNLDLSITYYKKEGFQYYDAYQNVPFQIFFVQNHPQPVNVRFELTFLMDGYFQLKAKSGKTSFSNFETNEIIRQKESWNYLKNGKLGEMIETEDFAFIIKPDSTHKLFNKETPYFGFEFKTVTSLSNELKKNLKFNVVDKMATVIELNLKSESLNKGIDIINELMNVYSDQNLARKNHTATITIDYIEKQLNEISDSLSQTEDNLQSFRSSNQLLNITDQATGISAQYMDLQNKLAELVTRKRYYDYVSDYLGKNINFSNMIVPASLGIQDPLLNNLMSELIAAQAQRSNLIENNQEKNPLVQKLGIQIENVKKTISENITAVGKTTSISIDEMNKRIKKTEADISRLPLTQRRLGNIERKYRLNDAIYNYMLEKRAEAKITKASNLPDDLIIEPAKMVGIKPISPDKRTNYLIALFLGLALPFGFITIKSALNNKIETQDDMERLTNEPLLGKILNNHYKTRNVMFEYPKSNIAESFRALRTNLDFYVRGGHKKVIMVTSCLEKEGKTFVAMNLAMSYAQLGKKTILVDFDLRKSETYFKEEEGTQEGLSTYLINKVNIEDIIIKSPHDKLDYILSGILPPNPIELIALDKTEKLLSRLKEDYDIIVLDTTPLAQVSDAYLLVVHAELKLIVTRQNYTLKNVFSLIMKDLKLKKVENVCIVLNDNRIYSDQYGYGYGYSNKGKGKKRKRRIGEYYSSESGK